MDGLILFTICLFGITILFIILVVKSIRRLKRKHGNLLLKYNEMSTEHRVLQSEIGARKEAFMQLSKQHPGLFAAYENALIEMKKMPGAAQ